MKKYNKKSLEKRKQERKDFPAFYKKHIQYIRDNKIYCQECGERLTGDVSEIAHVLPKGTFKSISVNDNNILYLCGIWRGNNCHTNFDNSSNELFRSMSVFKSANEKYEQLKQELTEKISYKIEDRYGK